jgi:ferredoxin-NADP reductase
MLGDDLPGPGAQCFACGRKPFVEVVNDLLVAGGRDARDVHAERFGPTGRRHGRAPRIDGNATAGLLGEIAGAEMTSILRTCQSCVRRLTSYTST